MNNNDYTNIQNLFSYFYSLWNLFLSGNLNFSNYQRIFYNYLNFNLLIFIEFFEEYLNIGKKYKEELVNN